MLLKKHVLTAMFLSSLMISSAFAEENGTANENNQEENTVAVVTEDQTQAQLLKLKEVMKDVQLVFPEKLAEIYAARDFSPIWQDENAKNQFLQDYALLGLTNVSNDVKAHLERLSHVEKNSLAADILVSDSWLNYLNYVSNVRSNAQNWLYDSYRYRAQLPSDEIINAWLDAVSQQQLAAFVAKFDQVNHRYAHTKKAI